MQEEFFRKIQDFTTAQANLQQEKITEIENRFFEKEEQLSESYGNRSKELDERETGLKKRSQELDDRANTHARRQLQKEFKKLFGDRSQRFELTTGTKRQRWWVLAGFVTLLGILGFVAGRLLFTVPSDDRGINTLLVVRQILFSVAFIVTAGFFLRWMNDWAQTHAQEEFKAKKAGTRHGQGQLGRRTCFGMED